MRAYEIIEKKRNNIELSEEEIKFFVDTYVDGEIPDYQMSAFLMAVYFNGMSDKECKVLTECMINSGDKVDLSNISGVKVDKHSTGGVGDKTTLIVAPIVAACGVKVAKMSGRGLGYTGGTIDKLMSIPGMNVELDKEDFFNIVNMVGCSIVSQTGNLVPADKKIYALRDVTATVESKPLIASSIMSKKIASGADCILLDVKVGDGAFMKTIDSVELSKIMVDIGKNFGKKVCAVITDMSSPLGTAIGNRVEVKEAYELLQGGGAEDLKSVCISLASNMLYLAEKGTLEECEKMANEVIDNGLALGKFRDMIKLQGGDMDIFDSGKYIDNREIKYEVTCDKSGYLSNIKAKNIGEASMILGAGRNRKEDSIDFSAGIVLNKKVGDKVALGDVLCTIYSSNVERCREAEKIIKSSVSVSDTPPNARVLIKAVVTESGVQKLY